MKRFFLLSFIAVSFGVLVGAVQVAQESCGVISHSVDNVWGGGGSTKRWVDFHWQCGQNPPCTGLCHVTVSYKLYKNYMHQGQLLLEDVSCLKTEYAGCCSGETFTETTCPSYDATILNNYGHGNYTLIFKLNSGDCGYQNSHVVDTFWETFTL